MDPVGIIVLFCTFTKVLIVDSERGSQDIDCGVQVIQFIEIRYLFLYFNEICVHSVCLRDFNFLSFEINLNYRVTIFLFFFIYYSYFQY